MRVRKIIVGVVASVALAGGASLGAAPVALAACADDIGAGVSWAGCDKTDQTQWTPFQFNWYLQFMDLSGTNLSGTNLYYGYVWGSNLTGANLTNANLVSLRLWEANLTSADFSGSDLTNAIFRDAYVDCGSRPVLGTGITVSDNQVYDLPEGWSIVDGTFTVPVVPCADNGESSPPIPAWVQAYGRGKDATCLEGWNPSWQSWAEPVTDGWVCTRDIPSLG